MLFRAANHDEREFGPGRRTGWDNHTADPPALAVQRRALRIGSHLARLQARVASRSCTPAAGRRVELAEAYRCAPVHPGTG